MARQIACLARFRPKSSSQGSLVPSRSSSATHACKHGARVAPSDGPLPGHGLRPAVGAQGVERAAQRLRPERHVARRVEEDPGQREEATHLFAVNPDEVRKGNIALKDVPYMQRGGSWDNSDLKGKKGWMKTGFGMTAYNDGKAEQKRELASDKKYNNIKPDIGFFGEALNWGGGAKGDDLAARAKRNGLTNDQQMWRDSGALS